MQVNIDFEPFKPINTSLYLCDNKFHTEALTALLADDNRFGFIVMDGNGALFGTLQVILHKSRTSEEMDGTLPRIASFENTE